jgi:Trypsin
MPSGHRQRAAARASQQNEPAGPAGHCACQKANTLGAVPNGLHSLPVGQVGTPAQPHPGRRSSPSSTATAAGTLIHQRWLLTAAHAVAHLRRNHRIRVTGRQAQVSRVSSTRAAWRRHPRPRSTSPWSNWTLPPLGCRCWRCLRARNSAPRCCCLDAASLATASRGVGCRSPAAACEQPHRQRGRALVALCGSTPTRRHRVGRRRWRW